MAVDSYIGWPSYVNKIILADSTFTIGEGALKTDELEGGGKRSRLKGSFCPDKFSIVMEFEGSENVTYTDARKRSVTLNKTELQLFYEWLKYKHKYGSVPFEFPRIIYSPQTGVKCVDDTFGNTQVEYYKITSSAECGKRGTWIQVKMTWESVYGGLIEIPSETDPAINGITKASKNFMDITFSETGASNPTSSLFTIYVDGTEVAKKGFYFDNAYTARIYFDNLTSGRHVLTFSMIDYEGTTAAKGAYTFEVDV